MKTVLEIRPEQRAALREHAIDRYVQRTLGQFRRHFPRHCEINGEMPMRRMIRLGADRARAHGFLGERQVVLYTSLMLLFGSFFDEDPQYAWPRRILANGNALDRATRLYETGVAHWERMAGRDNVKLVQAIRRLRVIEPRDFSPSALAGMVASKEELAGLIWSEGERIAHSHGSAETAVAAALVALLGAGFDKDPMFPWAAEAMAAGRLHEAAREYADRWLAHAREGAV